MATYPGTKPADLVHESACRLLPSTIAIAIYYYYYYLARNLRIRPHRMHVVHRFGLLLKTSHVAWFVCLSVYLSVFWSHGSAVQKQLNWSRCRLGTPCIRWGRDPPREGVILGVVWPIEKHYESMLRCINTAILNNGTACDADFRHNSITICVTVSTAV